MEDKNNLNDKKLASLILLQQYLENNEKDKAIIVAEMIEKMNKEIEKESFGKKK